jgi:hypothetical protein
VERCCGSRDEAKEAHCNLPGVHSGREDETDHEKQLQVAESEVHRSALRLVVIFVSQPMQEGASAAAGGEISDILFKGESTQLSV